MTMYYTRDIFLLKYREDGWPSQKVHASCAQLLFTTNSYFHYMHIYVNIWKLLLVS